MRVLVGYASAHGSTEEMARRIAENLQRAGLTAESLPIREVRSLDGFDAVVLGSAIHQQAWLPEAVEFVQRHSPDILVRPVWLFSVGMSDALPRPLRKPARAAQNRRLAAALRKLTRPRGHCLFSGVAHASVFPCWVRVLLQGMGGRFGDLRDWKQIDGWALDIARDLTDANPGAADWAPR